MRSILKRHASTAAFAMACIAMPSAPQAQAAAGDAPTMRHLHQSHEFGTLALDAFAFD